jgi:hypothetical protein
MTDEQMITIPLSEYTNLFNLAAVMQNKDQILATAQQRLQKLSPTQQTGPMLVKGKPAS